MLKSYKWMDGSLTAPILRAPAVQITDKAEKNTWAHSSKNWCIFINCALNCELCLV